MGVNKTIKVRTGELSISPGFWWVQHKDSGDSTVVQVTESGDANGPLGVMFIGNLNWPDLDEAIELVEFISKVPDPLIGHKPGLKPE